MESLVASLTGAYSAVLDDFTTLNTDQVTIQVTNTGPNPISGVKYSGSLESTPAYSRLDNDWIEPRLLTQLPTLAAGESCFGNINTKRLNLLKLELAAAGGTTIRITFECIKQDGDLQRKTDSLGHMGVYLYGASSTPIPVVVKNEMDIGKWSNTSEDFTATPTPGTYDIVLSTNTINGVALSDIHFMGAELEAKDATTGTSYVVVLDKFTWTFATSTLNVDGCTDAFEFGAGDTVSLWIPSVPKSYDDTNNADRIIGIESEGSIPLDLPVSIAGINVALDEVRTPRIDDPANILTATPALATYDKNLDEELTEIDANIGDVTDVAVTGDTAGSMSAKLRGFLKTLGEIDDGSLVNGSVTAILRYIGTQLETRLLSLDTKEGTTGDASDVDGTRAGQLRYIGEQINTLIGTTNTLLGTIDIDTGNISSKIDLIDTGIDNIETYTNAIKTAIEIIDDWDESDRAKVNLIAGQAGIDGDSGAKSAKTIRTVTSTDDPSIGSLGDAEDADGSLHAQLYYLANRLDAVEESIDEIETTVDSANDLMKVEEQSPALSAYSNTLIQDAITATAESAYYELLSNGKGFTIIYGDVTVTSGDVDIIITEADSGENVEVPQDTLNFSTSDTFIVRLEGTGKVKVGTTISADAVVTVAMDNRGGK